MNLEVFILRSLVSKSVQVVLLITISATSLIMAQPAKEIFWSRGADVPLPRGGYFAAWHDGGLWIAGGSYWKDGKKLWTEESSLYDPKKETWSKLGPIPRAIGYGATASVGHDLFLLGGTDAGGVSNTNIYRLRGKRWTKVGESPAGFIYPAYASVGAKIYIFGGSTSAADVTRATNEAWVFDTKTNKWARLEPIPGAPRQTFSAAAIGEDIYVFGGVTQKAGEKFHNLDDAYRFDTRNGKWSSLTKLPQAMRAFWAGSDGKNVYLIGGYSESGLDTVYRYSAIQDRYELVSKLPQPLMDTKFIFNDGKFYGASGEDKLMSRFSGMVIGQVK
jgi:N-acetylneuraminic acid mutarotase